MRRFRIGWCGPEEELAQHLQVLERHPQLELCACCCAPASPPPASPPHAPSVDALLGEPGLAGLVVCVPLVERARWCGLAVQRGHKVLCPPPLGDRWAQARRALPCQAAAAVAVASPACYSAVGEALRRVPEELGRVVYFELEVTLARQHLAARREGVLLRAGQDYLALVEAGCGPVDLVWAQSRSLLRNRPTEDLCVAYLKCQDGCEGLVRLHGLGALGQAQLDLFGVHGCRTVVSALDEASAREAWHRAYQDFAGFLAGQGPPRWSGVQAAGGLRLMQWLQQSARLGREVRRPEVVDEP
ncbi:MAG: hypothetical protein AB1505_28540 [Candidatus Latescibacterota bacterium]